MYVSVSCGLFFFDSSLVSVWFQSGGWGGRRSWGGGTHQKYIWKSSINGNGKKMFFE